MRTYTSVSLKANKTLTTALARMALDKGVKVGDLMLEAVRHKFQPELERYGVFFDQNGAQKLQTDERNSINV